MCAICTECTEKFQLNFSQLRFLLLIAKDGKKHFGKKKLEGDSLKKDRERRKFRFIRQTEFSPVLLTVCIFSSQSLEVNATVPYSSCLDLVKVGTCLRYTSFIESLLCGYFWTFLENWGTKLWYKKMRDKFIAIKRKILYNPNNGLIIFTAVLLKRFFG